MPRGNSNCDSPIDSGVIRAYIIEGNFEVCGEAVDGADAIEKTAFSEERRITWQSREQ
jgi:hypothetical protein